MKSIEKSSLSSAIPMMLLITMHLTLQLCCAFILLSSSPVSANHMKFFKPGTGHSYQLTSSVSMNEPGERKGKEIGYQVQGDVYVGVAWQNTNYFGEKLLVIELKDPKLLIQSTKGPAPHLYDVHNSYLDTTKGYPFFLHWKDGLIINVYTDKRETTSLENLKKGIAGLFQFQINDGEREETDLSGDCLVSYKSIDAHSISKSKGSCRTREENSKGNNDGSLLSGNLTSTRTSTFKISENMSVIQLVTTYEHHEFVTNIEREAGGSVTATQYLVLTDNPYKVNTIESSSLENALKEITKDRKLSLRKRDFRLEAFKPNCDEEDCPYLPKLLREKREYLSDSNLGTYKSAAAFVKLLSVARSSTKADLAKALKGSKNKDILTQLCDLAGAIQSDESHEAIMKIINFDSENDFDASERYLWALSTGSHPRESVIRDILKISQRQHSNEKLDETIVLTLASMTHRFLSIPGNENNSLENEVLESITGELDICQDEYCKVKYLRALKNLQSPKKSIPILIKHVIKGKTKSSVEAMKALRSFDSSSWTDEVIDMAQRVYFQAGKKYDSSCRTLALDILLDSKPRREILEELLLSLTFHDRAYEVKRYLVQRINQISEKDKNFETLVNSIKSKYYHLFNNYHVGAQRGLTTAFGRNFMNSGYRNGTLSTVLEISKGLLKRGIVDIVLENSESSSSVFTLGLFAGGLHSFVSSDEDDKESDEGEDVATAGMELTVLGSHIRPFIFFSGQGELMGHVWSGTASEKTPAYQAIILAIDYSNQFSLQNGFLVQIEVLGAVSFDLSGQIQISLWNKNAHSLVEKGAGISLQGYLKIDSSFVRSKIDFNVATEVKLNLQSDINFYGGNSLCMQLSQPEVFISHNVHKIERIPGGKHQLRRSKYKKKKIPGLSYILNKKNNEMCNKIFN